MLMYEAGLHITLMNMLKLQLNLVQNQIIINTHVNVCMHIVSVQLHSP